jgi:hypothetical protein
LNQFSALFVMSVAGHKSKLSFPTFQKPPQHNHSRALSLFLLGCTAAAQKRDDVALVLIEVVALDSIHGIFEGSLSFAAMQGVRGGAHKSSSGKLALPVFGRHISPALYQQLHRLKTTVLCGVDKRGGVPVGVASTMS